MPKGTTVSTAAEAAGVKCPADDLEWAKTHNCNDCPNQPKCLAAIHAALGV